MRAVPHFAVVISLVPSNAVPFILRAVASFVADSAIPDMVIGDELIYLVNVGVCTVVNAPVFISQFPVDNVLRPPSLRIAKCQNPYCLMQSAQSSNVVFSPAPE